MSESALERTRIHGLPRTRVLVIALLASVASLADCSSTSTPPPANVPDHRIVDLMVDGDTLSVLGAYVPQGSASNPVTDPADATMPSNLGWLFLGTDGTTLAQGAIADTRIPIAEFAEDGTAAPVGAERSSMIFSVRVPSVRGTFNLYDTVQPGTTGQQSLPLHTLTNSPAGSLIATLPVGAAASLVPEPAPADPTALAPSSNVTGATLPSDVRKIRAADPAASCPSNILIVPEAYTDMAAFHARAALVANYIAQSKEYGPYASAINFWTEDFVSQDSSIYDPGVIGAMDGGAEGGSDAAPPPIPQPKNTAFMCTWGTADRRRAIVSRALPVETANRLSAAVRYTNADLVVIDVNAAEYGGVASSFMHVRYTTVTDNVFANRIVLHEMGHALLSLVDEYTFGVCNRTYSGGQSINATGDINVIPWQDLVTDPIPTPDGTAGVGAFEGAYYCTTGVYRPTNTCLMRDLGSTFCPVCARQLQSVFGPRNMGLDGGPSGSEGGVALTTGSTTLVCRSNTLL